MMCSLLPLSIDRRAGGVDSDMQRIGYVSSGDPSIEDSTRGSCCGSSQGVTEEIGVEGDSLLRLEATSFVAVPKIDSSLAYIGLSMLIGYDAVFECTRVT